ncbi:hypothetical protein BX616_000277 [Lobosporangium transversale]|uniref:Uncharacterized protein n=1 Tax=Lobosporangium transversale TaxID=64571 RepID=A0A1Y2GWN0_9FUNG|nr:hypothetical protein BCR41DRAFT_347781 [Lobosporangium transversale]KAF9907964.1 hypothetical protein BX616_000277 [Lobosporangium transversale]ORZ26698.1 hypothetical protein BCR41DRAFT_347781 [Lobosporangium transversale]|eukprot:XP_021884461.1 hypothetical protein BCR41DRAFT_347781 [Lobosporangium transversale]
MPKMALECTSTFCVLGINFNASLSKNERVHQREYHISVLRMNLGEPKCIVEISRQSLLGGDFRCSCGGRYKAARSMRNHCYQCLFIKDVASFAVKNGTDVTTSYITVKLSPTSTHFDRDPAETIQQKRQRKGTDEYEEYHGIEDRVQKDEIQGNEIQEDEIQEDEIQGNKVQKDGIQEDGHRKVKQKAKSTRADRAIYLLEQLLKEAQKQNERLATIDARVDNTLNGMTIIVKDVVQIIKDEVQIVKDAVQAINAVKNDVKLVKNEINEMSMLPIPSRKRSRSSRRRSRSSSTIDKVCQTF